MQETDPRVAEPSPAAVAAYEAAARHLDQTHAAARATAERSRQPRKPKFFPGTLVLLNRRRRRQLEKAANCIRRGVDVPLRLVHELTLEVLEPVAKFHDAKISAIGVVTKVFSGEPQPAAPESAAAAP